MARPLLGCFLLLWALGAALPTPLARAEGGPAPSTAGHVLVPVYSFIFIGDNARPFPLAASLILRNVSLDHETTLLAVDYHDSAGKLIKHYLEAPRTLPPLGSQVFTVAESEKAGGIGAKFIVKWRAAQPILPPLAETVMIGTSNQQGISFTSRGHALPQRP